MSPLRYLKSSSNLYVAKNFIIWLMITAATLLIIIGFFETIETLRRVMRTDASFGIIMELSFLILPQRFIELLPFIVFLASLLSLWRLNQQQEITALRAMGVSGGQLGLGLFVTSILIGACSLTVLNPLAAVFNTRHVTLESRVLKRNHQSLTISNTGFWLKEIEGKTKTILHADSFSLNDRTFKNVTFYEFDMDDQFQSRIDSTEATLLEGRWLLKNTYTWRKGTVVAQKKEHYRPTHLTFEKIKQSSVQPNQLPFWRIPAFIKQQIKNGMSALVYEVYWHRLWAEVVLLGVMAILAVGFCLQNTRQRGASHMIGAALITGFIIHFFNNIIHAYGIGDLLAPILAAWIPPLVTGLLGIGYLMHAEESS